jgi:hypothetical protein
MIQLATVSSFSTIPAITKSTQSSSVEEIGLFDVLCGRDKNAFNNTGNRRFRVSVSLALERYINAPTRKDKSIVIKSVVTMVRNNGGRFLQESVNKHDGTVTYVELNDKRCHEKSGHALRDMALVRSAFNKPASFKSDRPSMSTPSTSTTSQTNLTPSSLPSAELQRLVDVASQIRVGSDVVSTASPSYRWLINTEAAKPEVQTPTQKQHPRITRNYESNVDEINVDRWDDASDVTSDESVFHDLVRLVAATNTNTTELRAIDTCILPSGMLVIQDESVPSEPAFNDDDEDDDVMEYEHSNATLLNYDPDRSSQASKPIRRLSEDSLVVDDRMVSWLVGESDFVLSYPV